ncbi:MAG: hypothetical protein RBS68_01710 [Anaerolineales bacterium]|nr:hypothetical protein [Anaerolineales bacterium]
MTSTLQKLPNEPIIVDSMSPDYNLSVELPQALPKLIETLEQLTEPVFWIVDVSKVEKMSVEDLLVGTDLLITGQNPLYRHRNIREAMYVTNNQMIRMAAAGVSDEFFGNLKIQVFETLEAALQYVRKQP